MRSVPEIYFINTCEGLSSTLKETDLSFVLLEYAPGLVDLAACLRGRGCLEVLLQEILSCVPPESVAQYVAAMSPTDKSEDISWWAHPLSRHLAIRESLFEAVSLVVGLDQYIKLKAPRGLVVITANTDIAVQMKFFSNDESYQVRCMIQEKKSWPARFKIFPVVLCWFTLRLFYHKCWCFFRLSHLSLQKINPVLVMSNFDAHSRLKCKDRLQDVYWGPLWERTQRKDNELSFIVQVNMPIATAVGIIHRAQTDRYIPKEVCLSWMDILRVWARVLWMGISMPKPPVSLDIGGRSFHYLVNRFWQKGLCSRDLVHGVAMYYVFNRIAKQCRVRKFLFLLENKLIEHGAILGLRRASQDIRIIGYQHAALKPKDLHVSVSRAAQNSRVLPDEIITTGPAASRLMRMHFGYTQVPLRDGCALRRTLSPHALKSRAGQCQKLLVILSTDTSEYCDILRFLEGACDDLKHFDVVLRPHPDINLAWALKLMGELKLRFRVEDVTVSLDQALTQTDVLLYASSTVPLEALTCGVPLIHLLTPGVLDGDTLFDYHGFKWDARVPSDIARIVDEIWQLPLAVFFEKQKAAAGYVEDYLTAVTDDCLKKMES